MKRLLNICIYIVFIFGIYGAGNLVLTEFFNGGTCPKLLTIPACYIIFGCLIIPFISHIFNKGKIIYFLLTTMAFIIAIYATIGQLFNIIQCPKTEKGIPMCYVSFAIFTSLIGLKIILLRKKV